MKTNFDKLKESFILQITNKFNEFRMGNYCLVDFFIVFSKIQYFDTEPHENVEKVFNYSMSNFQNVTFNGDDFNQNTKINDEIKTINENINKILENFKNSYFIQQIIDEKINSINNSSVKIKKTSNFECMVECSFHRDNIKESIENFLGVSYFIRQEQENLNSILNGKNLEIEEISKI